MWTNILYRTVVLVGLATQGDLWFDRTGDAIEARDEIELWQGARERAIISQTSIDTNTTAYTNHVWDWSLDDPSGKTWTDSTYDGTNWLNTTNTYKLGVLGTNVWYITNNNPTEIGLPETIDYFRWEQTNSQKFIQGAWTNITFADFDGVLFSGLNGTYNFAFRTNVTTVYDQDGYYINPLAPEVVDEDYEVGFMIDAYTNATGKFTIHDVLGWMPEYNIGNRLQYEKGYAYRGNGGWFNGDIIKLRGDPIQHRVEFNDFDGYFYPPTAHDIANVTVGGLIPNMNRDLPTFDVDLRKNAIDGIISFKKFIKITDTGRSIYGADVYLDHTLATGSVYTGFSDLPTLVATQVWDRLNIDYPLNDTWQTNTIVLTTNYAERYLALNYAKWSHTQRSGADMHEWISPYPTNGVHAPSAVNGNWSTIYTNGVIQYGQGKSTNNLINDAGSWATAISRAQANSANKDSGITSGDWVRTYDLAAPHSRLTWGEQALGGSGSTQYVYTARFFTKQAKAKSAGMDTLITDKSIGFWYVVADPNAEITTANSTYDAYSSGYTSNTYNQAGGSNYFAGASASVTSAVLGLLSIPSPWCDQPSGISFEQEIRGYITEGDGDANGIQADIAWTPTNANYFVYNGRGSTWDQAKARAPGNLIAGLNTKDLPSSPDFNDYGQDPVCGTYGVSSAGITGFTTNYLQAKAEWDEVYLISTNYIEMAGYTDGYIITEPYDRNNTVTTGVFDDNGTGLVDTNTYQRFSVSNLIVSGVATSGWLTAGFSATNLPAWTDEPALSGNASKGFQRKLGSADAEDMVLKWDFIYCTNSL